MFKPTSNPYKFKYLVTGITGPGIPEVYLPEVPKDEKKIHFKKEQKFVRPEPSDLIKKAISECAKQLRKNRYFLHPLQHAVNAWADQERKRSVEGFWFWNNGEATYLTPFHYWYLTAWTTYFGHPDYREPDKEICYFVQYCEEDPECYGAILNTIRRYGKSSLMGAWATFRTTRNFSHFTGMQGETDDKIAAFYTTHIKNPFKKLPFYFTPVYDTSSALTSDIRFEKQPERGKKAYSDSADDDDVVELESYIEYRQSGEGAYDQAVLHTYLAEEPGKCHPEGTKIRMFDGSVKNVEDVKEGELLRGTDNIPRVVIKKGGGYGKIYKITPNSKSEPWYVNEDHILSCKVSSSKLFKGLKKGDVLNISIKDYLNSNKSVKKHLMCYRVGVEYPERKHLIDPYFLGVWLGDGSSDHIEVAGIDEEIFDWLKTKYSVTKRKTKNRTQAYYVRGQRNLFTQLGLLKNKHIPNEYLIDSRENRLKLLAGLIDTDGHKCAKKDRPTQRYYEIIQKNKRIADAIKELGLSLGFNVSMYKKVATMKRKDGTIYSCDVYRLSLYGRDLHDIPCKVARKKMQPNGSLWNVKDPGVYGFKVEYDRDDHYYGFNISGNRLYLLADYTVTHNTLKANVSDRWDTVKPCLRRGKYIRGKALFGTTVEFMDTAGKGGRAYKGLFFDSDFDNKGRDLRTASGLYASFLPGDCAYEGFFDEWGRPMRAEAKESILIERESVRKKPKKYSALIRKYPLTIKEIFWISSENCEFNSEVLQDRKSELDMMTTPILIKGYFQWKDRKRFTQVEFKHDDAKGWATIHSLINDPKDQNLVEVSHFGDQVRYAPKNDDKFAAGIDPVDHGIKIEGRGGDDEVSDTRRSRPVLLIKRKYDTSIDGILDEDTIRDNAEKKVQYKTNRYIAMMDVRPNDPLVIFERALMMCWYFGVSLHVESQKPGVMNYFHEHNCGDFVLQKYIPESANSNYIRTLTDGTPASTMTTSEYTDAMSTYIEYFGHTIPFPELLEDLLLFNPKKTTEFDYAVAMGFTELACKIKPKKVVRPMVEITDYMPEFDEYGNVVG